MTRIPTIACDLDGTLAHYDEWRGIEHIGDPISRTLERVKVALAQGWIVEIFTARVAPDHWRREDQGPDEARCFIEAWCLEHVGQVLPVTAIKSGRFDEFWDDKAVSVEKNGGCGAAMFVGSLWSRAGQP